jgi:hypothetical protein
MKLRARSLVLFLACGACSACVEATNRFVRSDQQFTPAPRLQAPKLLVNQSEVALEPPFKWVGVLEIQGSKFDSVNSFLARLANAGAKIGCEYVVQRDLFGLGSRLRLPRGAAADLGSPLLPTSMWVPNDLTTWQFFCGAGRVTLPEAWASRDIAIATALDLRADVLGLVCQPYTPIGSHIRIDRVCEDARQRR